MNFTARHSFPPPGRGRAVMFGSVFFAVSAALAAFGAAEKGDARRGRVVYMDNCVPCHGEEGNGQGPLGVQLGARDFTKGKFKFGSSDGELFETVSSGISPKMPAWKDKLSSRERRDAIAFVRMFAKPRSRR